MQPARALAFLVMGILAACTTPYNRPVVEAPDQPGVLTAFEGLKDQLSPAEPLHVLYVHGMCTHGEEWVVDRSNRIATALDAQGTSPGNPRHAGAIGLYERGFASPEGDMRITFVVWSSLTATEKGKLVFDSATDVSGGRFPFQRASLNDDLKTGLLNDCLTDAVIYSGPSGDRIRKDMRHALCEALGGTFDRTDDLCTFDETRPAPRLALISESLGSKLLFDAVCALSRDAVAQPLEQQAAFARQLRRASYLYMLANQIPILDRTGRPCGADVASGEEDVSAATAPDRSSLGDFLAIRRSSTALGRRGAGDDEPASAQRPMTIVAFTDPNDLLSYRLLPDVVDIRDERLINVIVSNAPTIAGWVERPDTAHSGYGENAHVVEYLIDGYDGAVP